MPRRCLPVRYRASRIGPLRSVVPRRRQYGCRSFSQGGWIIEGGTSLAAPCWAAMIALADQARLAINPAVGTLDGATQTLPALYSLPKADFTDILVGYNDNYNFSNLGLYAQPGYDQVTGLGSPIANLLIPALAAYSACARGTCPRDSWPGHSGRHHKQPGLDSAVPLAAAAPVAAPIAVTTTSPPLLLLGALIGSPQPIRRP